MTSLINRNFAFGATALAMVMTAPAYAQGTAEGGVADDSTTADAFDRGPAIVVTARRVEEDLQDVPISITVFDQQQLTNNNVAVASDLATYTPSLSVNQRFGAEKASFSIRGFNQEASTAPTVGVYFADVVGVRAQGGTTSGNTVGAGSFTDLENVQVLKGPQGTLFGRNTTGGSILLVPKKPGIDFEGYVEGTYGNFDQQRVQAAVNVPLADGFYVRAATDINKRDGFMRNRSGIGPDAYNDVDYQYFRLGILAELSPDVENYTLATYSNSETNGYASHYEICDRNALTPGNPRFLGGAQFSFTRFMTNAAACDQIDRQNARGDGPWDVEVSNPNPLIDIETWQFINTTTALVSDNLTVKNIMSYGEFRESAAFNLYSDNFFIPAIGGALGLTPGAPFKYIQLDEQPGYDAASGSTMTEELQLQGEFENFNFVVGGYLEFSRPIGFNQQRTGIFGDCADPGTLQCNAPLGFALISQSRTKLSFDNHGIFAQGTYNFTDQLALTLGGRYTFDKVVGFAESSRITFAPTPIGVIPVRQTCNDSLKYPTTNVLATRGAVSSGSTPECRTDTLVQESNEPTWLVNLDYKPTQDLLLYAKYARGYRQGGINFTNPGLETWEPEKVDSFEVGAKASFYSGSFDGYFNIAGFYNDFSDQQVFGTLIPKPAFQQVLSGGAGIINAGKSTLQGIEIDTSINIVDIFNISAGYTYLDTELKELIVPQLAPNAPFLDPIPRGVIGGQLPYSPKHKLTLSARVDLPVPETFGDISFGGTYLYTSKQVIDGTQIGVVDNGTDLTVIGQIPETHQLNLNFNWERVADSPIDLALFMTNVTNEANPVASGGGYSSSGVGDLLYAPPRMYGVRLKFNFGPDY